MSFKIITATIMCLLLAMLPLGFIQNTNAAATDRAVSTDMFGTTDPMAMLGSIWEFVTEKGPQLIGQIFEIVMAILFSIMAFVQTLLAMVVNPQGIPLLFAMGMNGLNYAFSYGLTFAIYGAIISLLIPILPLIIGIPLGAVVGIIFGALYGFVYGSEAEMPEQLENPFITSWPESIFPE